MGRLKQRRANNPNYANKYLVSFLSQNKSTVCFYTDGKDKVHISMSGIDYNEFSMVSEVFIRVPEIRNFFREAIKAADEFTDFE